MKYWAIYSASENAFWNNQTGWVAEARDASPLSDAEKIKYFNNLPITKDGDAKWVLVAKEWVVQEATELVLEGVDRDALLSALVDDDIGTIRRV